MSSARYVMAIDLGTGGPKVALVSSSGQVIFHAFEAVEMRHLPGGGAEQDPFQWWSSITACARRVLEDSGIKPPEVAGIGCTAQWSGTVACDEAGSALHPAITWMDSRGSSSIRRQVGGPLNVLGYDPRKLQRWIRLTGGAPGLSGKDPCAHILWLRETQPEIYRATFKFLEPVDWLNQQLTGRFCASHDSITLHWVTDNRRRDRIDYDPGLLELTGLERAKLPDLVPTGEVVGTLESTAACELGLLAGIPVCTGTGDLHSAAVGSGAVADYAGHLYIGTSSWISCHVPHKKTDALRNVASIPAGLAHRYLIADEHETAGECLDFLVDRILWPADGLGSWSGARPEGDVYGHLNEVAEKVPPGANGVLFTPWLNGERSPVDDHTIRGGFHNLSLSSTRDDMVRAVFEGVAFNSRWLLEAVEKFAGRRFGSLSFIGGGAQSDLWCQIHADVTGRRIDQMQEPVLANARGAGLLMWLALGEVKIGEIPSMVKVKATYEPDPSTRSPYRELYREFVNLYKRTKAIHRRLNRT